MKELRCVYWDDDPKEFDEFKSVIEDAWASVRPRIPIEVFPTSDIAEAKRLVEEGVQLVVSDILLGDSSIARNAKGFELVRAVRGRPENRPVIIALTREKAAFENAALEAGVDEVVSKQTCVDGTDPRLERLGAIFVKWLEVRGFDAVRYEQSELDYDVDDLELRSMMTWIGEEVFRAIVHKLVDREWRRLDVSLVDRGYSGAFVCRVNCEFEVKDEGVPASRVLLVKLSRDGGRLRAELEKASMTSMFPGGLFVNYLHESFVEHRGWAAIASEYQEQSATLIGWLSENQSRDQVQRSVGGLLSSEGLGGAYRHHALKGVRPGDAFRDVLPIHRQARLKLALRDLGGLCSEVSGWKATRIESFVASGRIGQLDIEKQFTGVEYCRCHGDLHGRNVLVTRFGRPVLIDPEAIGEYPWCSDISRLSVDLVLVGVGRGIEAFRWDDFSRWRDLVQAMIAGEIVERGWLEDEKPVQVALEALRGNLSDIFPFVSEKQREGQFRLGLAAELIRCGIREDLPAPKRCLALVGADDALESSEQYLGQS